MKKCARCHIVKSESSFHKDCRLKCGLSSYCKKCNSDICLEYDRSKKGVVTMIYNTQKRNGVRRGHGLPEYSKGEFSNWLLGNDDFDALYDAWVKSGYQKLLKPSVDRLSDYLGYSFQNIRICTWEENMIKSHKDRRDGFNNKYNTCVVKMDLNGNDICEYHSMCHAARVTGARQANISKVCVGVRNTAGGFKWRYKKDKK